VKTTQTSCWGEQRHIVFSGLVRTGARPFWFLSVLSTPTPELAVFSRKTQQSSTYHNGDKAPYRSGAMDYLAQLMVAFVANLETLAA